MNAPNTVRSVSNAEFLKNICNKPPIVLTVNSEMSTPPSHLKSFLLCNVYKVKPTTMVPVRKNA